MAMMFSGPRSRTALEEAMALAQARQAGVMPPEADPAGMQDAQGMPDMPAMQSIPSAPMMAPPMMGQPQPMMAPPQQQEQAPQLPVKQAGSASGIETIDHGTSLMANLPQITMPRIKPRMFGAGGFADKAGDVLGDVGLNLGAMLGVPSAVIAMHKRAGQMQQGQWQQRHDIARGDALADRNDERTYEANQPRYFGGGQDQVQYDPTTGKSRTIYDAPMPAEAYATNFGAPGSDGYKNALQSYTLRGWSDEALGNRSALEDVRYRNRASLRSQPTYKDAHPRAPAPRAAPQATPNNVLGGILAKAAAGGSLSAPEQDLYNTWKNGRQRAPTGRGARFAPAAAAPVRVNSPAEAAKLPSGTMFQGTDGVTRIRP